MEETTVDDVVMMMIAGKDHEEVDAATEKCICNFPMQKN